MVEMSKAKWGAEGTGNHCKYDSKAEVKKAKTKKAKQYNDNGGNEE